VLYLQVLQMMLSIFNGYTNVQNHNFQILNQLQSIFSVLFCVTNTFMASLVVENRIMHYILTFLSYFGLFVIIIIQNFQFVDMDYDSICSLVLSLIYLLLFVPTFNYITITIIDEQYTEAKLSFL